MNQVDRIIVIVLDGVGAGEAPDAGLYGDIGSNSLGNTDKAVGGLDLPNLGKIGLGHITPLIGVPPAKEPEGAYGKMTPVSAGKDTISGHWEMMGVIMEKPLPTYPDGFPDTIIKEYERRIGRGTLGNKAASGTEIIKELGMAHINSAQPIVYTSADSVFQIAAHEEIIPIEQLYSFCMEARSLLVGEHGVGRVIARPFIGSSPENFTRTQRRRDFPLLPPGETMLQRTAKAGLEVCTVGKIDDIFAHVGITRSKHNENNADSLTGTLEFLQDNFRGLIFTNLVEFDMLYGHRNDPTGYAAALKRVDDAVPLMKAALKPGDILIFVADHGVDPTTLSTDHSREFSPLLVYGEHVTPGVDLGTRKTFSDVAATIAEAFALEPPLKGTSFLSEIFA